MFSLKQHLLLERVGKSDIIDLFIIMSMPEPSSKSGKFILNEVVNKSRKNILDEIENIILYELEYINPDYNKITPEKFVNDLFNTKYNSPDVDMLLKELTDIIYNAKRKSKELSISQINKELNVKMTFDSIAKTFDRGQDIWEENYGGPGWAQFTRTVKQLYNQKEPSNFLKSFERIVDFIHNTGTFLEKFHGFKKGWMSFILDLKQNTQNIRDLFPYASKDIHKLLNDPNWRIQIHQATQGRNISANIPEKVLYNALTNKNMNYINNLIKHYGGNKVKEEAIKLINNMNDFDFEKTYRTLGFIGANNNNVLSYLKQYLRKKYDDKQNIE